jgi:hypothetical protein
MYKDTHKTSSRKTLILSLVVILHACGLLFIAHVNNWFPVREHAVDKEKEKTVNNDTKTEEMEAENDVKEQTLTANKIYLPEQMPLQDQDVNSEPKSLINEEADLPFSRDPLPIENNNTKVASSLETEIQSEIIHENIDRKDIEKHALEPGAIPELTLLAKETIDDDNDFDFTEYSTSLIKDYGKLEGEKTPLLLIDDHNKNELYKKGLEFYGYRLIARPKIRPREPYYFVINDSGIQLLQETCPYAGAFPSVHQEDRKIFKGLLQQPRFGELSKNQHQIFYAPIDTQMLNVVESKQKLIIESMGLEINQVSRMVGTFKKVGSSYILIIESIRTVDGRFVKVRDPDNRIMTASIY